MFEVYKPSGAFGIFTFFYLLISLVFAVLLAFVYAYGLRYVPFIYISVGLTAVFGLALGMLGAIVVKRGHCRNTLLAGLIGVLLSLETTKGSRSLKALFRNDFSNHQWRIFVDGLGIDQWNSVSFAMKDCERNGLPLSLLMMDMDGLKKINDTHGHLFGTYAIGQTGKLIARVIGGSGQACRFGGDEFIALLPAHDIETATALAEEIRLAVETEGLEKDEISLKPTLSIGVAAYPDTGDNPVELVASADGALYALYRAKAMGKNCVAF